jgi:lipopolysaccharide export system permease protein
VIIFRYFTKEILATLLAATLVLLVIFVTNQSVQFLQRAANGAVPATEILQLIGLQVPLLLGYLLPLGLYLGVLLTLGRMHIESEMTVLAACGMSRAKIMQMILVIAVGVSLVVAWLMASLVPLAQGQINNILNRAAASASVAQIIPGRFTVFGNDPDKRFVFYAQQVEKHAILHHVFMAKKMEAASAGHPAKWQVIVANKAYEQNISGQVGRYLIFDKGYRYAGVPGQKDYQKLQFDQYGVRLPTNQIAHLNAAQYYSISKLLSPANPEEEKDFAAELQWRLAMPIAAFLFALLAVPLSEVPPRYGKFTQLFPAMLIYLTYADLIFLSRSWIQSGRISPALGMWWVHGSVLVVVFLLMLYRVGWMRIRSFFKS